MFVETDGDHGFSAGDGTSVERMSTSSKGRAFEHEVRNLFRSAGFSVIRGAGSKGELFGEKVDLVATKRTRDTAYTVFLYCIGVQCKTKSHRRKTSHLTPHARFAIKPGFQEGLGE